MRYYKLIDKTPVPCSIEKQYISYTGEKVQHSTIGFYYVSTIFLGADYNFGLSDHPIFFETMIFNHYDDRYEYQERCSTWEEAQIMHQNAVETAHKLVNEENLAYLKIL